MNAEIDKVVAKMFENLDVLSSIVLENTKKIESMEEEIYDLRMRMSDADL